RFVPMSPGPGRTRLPHPSLRGPSPLNFVVRVVNRLGSVLELAEAAPHPQGAARVDAGDAALTQPHERDGVAAVEQFGAHPAGAGPAVALHAAQRADHRDLLATFAIDSPLRTGARDLVRQFLRVALLRVLRQPAGEPAKISLGPHGHS